MSLIHGAGIIKDNLILCYDSVNPKDNSGVNALKNLISDTYNGFRFYTSGTTTVEGVTYNRTDLCYKDTTGIVFNPKPPLPINVDSPTFYAEGGNWFEVDYDIPWRTDDFTWIVWVYFDSLSSGGLSGQPSPYILDWKRQSGQNTAFTGGANPAIAYRITVSPFTTYSVQSDVVLNYANKWNFMCVRRSAGTVQFFNGFTKSSPLSFNIDMEIAQNLGIGWGSDIDYQWRTLDGIIGPIHIYNRALTDLEIDQNFQAMRGRFSL